MVARQDSVVVPDDWYRFAYPPEMDKLPWAQKTDWEVDRLITMLKPTGGERVLDLACGTGRHTLELTRRGFDVVGVELLEANVRVARETAQAEGLDVEFLQADLRELELADEFDVVLSLNDGAIGYFESDEENLKAFATISRALRSGGRHLLQIANVLHAEAHPSVRDWIAGAGGIELVDHRWNDRSRCLEGTTVSIPFGEVFEAVTAVPFRKRLYSVEELAEIYAMVEMSLAEVLRGNGRPGLPRDNHYEVFVVGQKGS